AWWRTEGRRKRLPVGRCRPRECWWCRRRRRRCSKATEDPCRKERADLQDVRLSGGRRLVDKEWFFAGTVGVEATGSAGGCASQRTPIQDSSTGGAGWLLLRF